MPSPRRRRSCQQSVPCGCSILRLAVDERHQQHCERRVDDPDHYQHRPVDRCERIRVRVGRDVRGLNGVHDPGGLPDESLRLRARRVHVLWFPPRRRAIAVSAIDRHRSRDRVLLGRPCVMWAVRPDIQRHYVYRSKAVAER